MKNLKQQTWESKSKFEIDNVVDIGSGAGRLVQHLVVAAGADKPGMT